ncbi:MAG TPA: oxygenase MpaB family protein [Streptosporangiaceae bacterium]|jgi:uncharacterized protein (DUF2236 family)
MTESTKLYGPDSVTWRVHTDPAMFVAGVRALYLQSLYPRAMWGVAQNSNVRDDTWGRLQRTVDYVLATTFGTEADAERAAARVRKIHATLRATDLDTGEEFRIDAPDALMWVHCAEVDSYLAVTRRSGLRLTDDEADRYVDEQRSRAARVGLDPAGVPGSRAELAAYFDGVRPLLRATPEAHASARFLLAPPMPLWLSVSPVRVAYAGLSALCFAALPPWARRMYGMPVVPGAELGTTAALIALRQTLGRVPPRNESALVVEARRLLRERADDQRSVAA